MMKKTLISGLFFSSFCMAVSAQTSTIVGQGEFNATPLANEIIGNSTCSAGNISHEEVNFRLTLDENTSSNAPAPEPELFLVGANFKISCLSTLNFAGFEKVESDGLGGYTATLRLQESWIFNDLRALINFRLEPNPPAAPDEEPSQTPLSERLNDMTIAFEAYSGSAPLALNTQNSAGDAPALFLGSMNFVNTTRDIPTETLAGYTAHEPSFSDIKYYQDIDQGLIIRGDAELLVKNNQREVKIELAGEQGTEVITLWHLSDDLLEVWGSGSQYLKTVESQWTLRVANFEYIPAGGNYGADLIVFFEVTDGFNIYHFDLPFQYNGFEWIQTFTSMPLNTMYSQKIRSANEGPIHFPF
ncbi:MAG: hypothetical protein AAGB12_01680 [Pseudomonadota bacterium]